MPQFLEDKLKAEARKKKLKGRDADAYVYGTMNGAMHGNQETATGAEMEAKHDADEKPKRKRITGHRAHGFNWRTRHGQRKVG